MEVSGRGLDQAKGRGFESYEGEAPNHVRRQCNYVRRRGIDSSKEEGPQAC